MFTAAVCAPVVAVTTIGCAEFPLVGGVKLADNPPLASVIPVDRTAVPAVAVNATTRFGIGFPFGSSAAMASVQGPAAMPAAAGVAKMEREATDTTERVTLPDCPPPGPGLATETFWIPAFAKDDAGTEAV